MPHAGSSSSPSSTEFARIDLPGGSFDAFRAVKFSSEFPPHFHETFAIGVVETGAARLRTPRGEWTAGPGTILAFAPGEVHGAEPLSRGGYTYRMIYPSADFMGSLRQRVAASMFRLPVIHDPALGRVLQRAHLPLMEGSAGTSAEDGVVRLLRKLLERYAMGGAAIASSRPRDDAMVEAARQYMHDGFQQTVRLGALAKACGTNVYHLIRVFRRIVGVPPYAYLLGLRVNRAQVLLGEGCSVADVAYSCGFSDQSHLTRTFKRVVGIPPGQYVRSIRAA